MLDEKLLYSTNPVAKEHQRVIKTYQPIEQYQGNPIYGGFQASGLRWQGKKSVSSNKLQKEKEKRIGNYKRKEKEGMTSFETPIIEHNPTPIFISNVQTEMYRVFV